MVLPALVFAVFGFHRVMRSLAKAAAATRGSREGGRRSRLAIGTFAVRSVWLFLAIAVGLNFVLLPVRCLLAAQEAVPSWHFLYDASQKDPLIAFSANSTAYDVAGLKANFYRGENIQTIVTSDFRDAAPSIADAPQRLWISVDGIVSAPPGLVAQRVYAYDLKRPQWLRCGLRWCNDGRWHQRLTVWRVTKSGSEKDIQAR
jgi:hypothetical protein